MSGRVFPELSELFTARGYDLVWAHSLRSRLCRGPEQWAAEAEMIRDEIAPERPCVILTDSMVIARALRADPKLLDVRGSRRPEGNRAVTAVADFGGVYIPALGKCVAALVVDVGPAVTFEADLRVVFNPRGEPSTPLHPRLGHAFRALEGAVFEGRPSKYFAVTREPRRDVERVLRAFFGEERYPETLRNEGIFGEPRVAAPEPASPDFGPDKEHADG